MDNFMKYDFNINKILLAILVLKGTGSAVHRDRVGHGLAFNIEGEKIYSFKSGESIHVVPNDIIYLPKHSCYTVSSITPGDCYAINFDIDEEVNFPPFAFRTKNCDLFIDCFKKVQKSWNAKKEGFALNCKAQLYNILYNMQKEHSSEYISSGKLSLIMPAVEYIRQHYSTELLRIDTLSAMCNITPEYFRSIFKNHFGVSPLSYINSLKVDKAKNLIESGLCSVSEAAFLSGFSDISHFSRVFKKTVGISPSELM